MDVRSPPGKSRTFHSCPRGTGRTDQGTRSERSRRRHREQPGPGAKSQRAPGAHSLRVPVATSGARESDRHTGCATSQSCCLPRCDPWAPRRVTAIGRPPTPGGRRRRRPARVRQAVPGHSGHPSHMAQVVGDGVGPPQGVLLGEHGHPVKIETRVWSSLAGCDEGRHEGARPRVVVAPLALRVFGHSLRSSLCPLP